MPFVSGVAPSSFSCSLFEAFDVVAGSVGVVVWMFEWGVE